MRQAILFFSFILSFVFAIAQEESKVFTFVDQMPEYKGGEVAMMKFLKENIQYPQMERDSDIQGKVVLRLIVMEDGKVDSVKVLKSVEAGLDSEAIRVVKMLSDFIPGKQDGKPVKVYYTIPVTFKLTYNSSSEISSATANSLNAHPDEYDPEFPGGVTELLKFLVKNIHYPEMEKWKEVQGRVRVGFTVMEDGSLSDVRVIRGVSPGLDKEALRVVKLFPKFIPAQKEGKPVKFYFQLPIGFSLHL